MVKKLFLGSFCSLLFYNSYCAMTIRPPELIKGEGIEELALEKFEKQVLGSTIPVVVKFFTPVCPSCDAMNDLDEKMERMYKNSVQTLEYPARYSQNPSYKIRIFKINMEQDKELTKRYNIAGAPTYLFFKGGRVVARHSGQMDEALYRKKIDELLK